MESFRPIIGVMTTHHPSRWHRRQILLEQCFKNSPIPYKFVFGDEVHDGDWERTGIPEDDVLHAPGSDAKEFMPLKNLAFFRYAIEHGYTHCLRICCDTWVFPDRILNAGLEAFDLAGAFSCKFKLGGTFSIPFKYLNYPHGGCGVWLSRRAMEMLVTVGWDEHHLDSWPEMMDVGFGIKFPKPPYYWDDVWIGEVLQGSLAYDDPIRNQPLEAYTRNGISLFEDEMLFWNDEPKRPLTIHDPGVHKPNDHALDEIIEGIRKRNVAAVQTGQVALPVRIEAGPLPVEEVSNAD